MNRRQLMKSLSGGAVAYLGAKHLAFAQKAPQPAPAPSTSTTSTTTVAAEPTS